MNLPSMRVSLLCIVFMVLAVSCRSGDIDSGLSNAETVQPKDIVNLICGSQPDCLSTLCPDAGHCPLQTALANKAVFDFVETYAACEGCAIEGFSSDKCIGC